MPLLTPDYRDSTEALVHKDLRLTFDGNRYCTPPRYVGHKLTVKADSSSVTIYDQTHEIVCYARCWERGQTFGAERFQKELYAQMAAAQRSAAQQRLVRLLGPVAESYLRELAGGNILFNPPESVQVKDAKFNSATENDLYCSPPAALRCRR